MVLVVRAQERVITVMAAAVVRLVRLLRGERRGERAEAKAEDGMAVVARLLVVRSQGRVAENVMVVKRLGHHCRHHSCQFLGHDHYHHHCGYSTPMPGSHL